MKYYLMLLIEKLYYWYFKVSHKSMYKNPEKLIPKHTDYCYELLSVDNKTGKQKVKLCPYMRFITIMPKYAGQNQICMYDGGDCEGDSCKTCGINTTDD